MKRRSDGTHEPGLRWAGQADAAPEVDQAELDAIAADVTALQGTTQVLYEGLGSHGLQIAALQETSDDFFEGAPEGNLYAVTQRILNVEIGVTSANSAITDPDSGNQALFVLVEAAAAAAAAAQADADAAAAAAAAAQTDATYAATATFGTLAEQFRARSATFMPGGYAADFDDFTANTMADWSNGVATANTSKGPGVWDIPNSNFALISKAPIALQDPSATPWHLGGRLRFIQAVAAADRMGLLVGTGGFTNFFSVGRYQAFSATHFVFTLNKAGVLTQVASTIPLDTTTFHILEMWFDGNNVYGSIDNETPVLVGVTANVPSALALWPLHGVLITGSAGGNAIHMDAAYLAAGRTAT